MQKLCTVNLIEQLLTVNQYKEYDCVDINYISGRNVIANDVDIMVFEPWGIRNAVLEIVYEMHVCNMQSGCIFLDIFTTNSN